MSRLFLKCVTESVLLRVNFQSLQTFCLLINKNSYHHSNAYLYWISNLGVVFLERKNYRQLSMHHNWKNIEKHGDIIFLDPQFLQEAVPDKRDCRVIIEKILYTENYLSHTGYYKSRKYIILFGIVYSLLEVLEKH